MRIDRHSWHYRWATAGQRWNEPDNLCDYVRRVMVSGLCGLVCIGAVGVTMAMGLFCLEALVLGIWLYWEVALSVALVVLAALAVVLLRKKPQVIGVVRAPSAWALYQAHRAAKKAGLCPALEYAD